jgi:predicted MFS family arabinose efflux permease
VRKINPWWIVFGSTLALIVCNGPVLAFTFGLFLKPVSEEFGWDRGTTSAASAMASLMLAVGAPFTGMLVDRFGVRRVLLPVIALSSLAVAAISFARGSPLIFIGLYTVAGLASAGQGPLPYAKTIAAWFDRKRGLAIGIAMSGVGIGIIVVPQLVVFLIQRCGWREAYLGLGALAFAVAFPAVAIFLHEPCEGKTSYARSGKGLAGLPGRFWLLAAPIFLVAIAVNGTIVHLVPLLTDRGVTPSLAVGMLGAVGIASIVGRLSSGYLVDRFFAPQVAAGFFLLPCIGLYLLAIESDYVLRLIAVISLGLALGCEIDMMAFLTTRYFGLQRFGELYGYLFAVFSAGAALGVYLMATSYDAFHSYNAMLTSFIIALLTASVLVWHLGGYAFPAGRSAVSQSFD